MRKLLLTGILIFYMSFSQTQINYDWYIQGVNNNPSHKISFTVNNRLDIALKKEGIMIKRTDLPMQNIAELSVAIIDPKLARNPEPTVDELRKIGGYLMRKESNGHSIPLQIDDIDKVGIWDELFFLTDLAPHEIRQFYIYPYERGLYEHKVHGAIGNYGRHTVPFKNIKNDGGNHVFTIPLTASLDYQYMVFAGWSFGEVRNNETCMSLPLTQGHELSEAIS